jgi:hypothetical protein
LSDCKETWFWFQTLAVSWICILSFRWFPGVLLVHTTHEDGTECSVTSAHKIHTPGSHTKKEYKKIEFSWHIFEKCSNVKFYENPSNGNRVVTCGQSEMTKLIVAFRIFANAPKTVQCVESEKNFCNGMIISVCAILLKLSCI